MRSISRHMFTSINHGCDPELFFALPSGEIIGSERVIEEKTDVGKGVWYTGGSTFVRDGVQVELNPAPSTCRAALGLCIAYSIKKLRDTVQARGDGVKISFSPVVKVSAEELDRLSEKSRVLGCMPSKNIYDSKATISPDAARSGIRSAGGHLHLGLKPAGQSSWSPNVAAKVIDTEENVRTTVRLLDVIVGNTCVLLDRDPANIERRKVYGRAGEYRLPPHGLEYRTLSNFWLRSYPLTSMVHGLAKLAVTIKRLELDQEFLSTCPPADVVAEAINTNNAYEALEGWRAVRGLANSIDWIPDHDYGTPLWRGSETYWDHFIKRVEDHGLKYWFPEDPITHWCKLAEAEEAHGCGFEWFLLNNVRKNLSGRKKRHG